MTTKTPPRPLFKDKVRLLYQEFDHYTPSGDAIYTYVVERLEYFDQHAQEYRKWSSFDTIKLVGGKVDLTVGDRYVFNYTRRTRKSWGFKLLSVSEYTTATTI